LKEFGREHLHELSVELSMVHIHNVILPKLVKDRWAVQKWFIRIAGQIWLIVSQCEYRWL